MYNAWRCQKLTFKKGLIILFLYSSLFTFLRLLIRAWVVLLPHPEKLGERFKLELENKPSSPIKGEIGLTAHVSSEGEFQQVLPVIHEFLSSHKEGVQILYTSPSVMKAVNRFRDQYPERVQVWMLPIFRDFFNHSLNQFVKGRIFIMVRYDFFPHLLALAKTSSQSILLSATLKGKWSGITSNPLKKAFWKTIFYCFRNVVCTTDSEKENFKILLGDRVQVLSYEFRIPQILKRQENSKESLAAFAWTEDLEKILNTYQDKPRLILGSAWEHDLKILWNQDIAKMVREREVFIFIAPHKLDRETLGEFEDQLKTFFGEPHFGSITPQGLKGSGNVILSGAPGVLCELYPLFDHIYIGGGFGRSVHSVLEPFWSGGEVYLGPRIHRSTEVDFFHENGERQLHIFEAPSQFSGIFQRALQNREDIAKIKDSRSQLAAKMLGEKEMILKKLAIK